MDARVAELAGKVVKHWRLDERPLKDAATGQAWLYAATDVRSDERVVVKVFRPERSGDVDREVAALEAIEAVGCRHAASFRAWGTHGTGDHVFTYVVMTFVRGCPLDELIGWPVFDLDDRLEILTQIAEGLGELHEASIVHRDLKPANVIVRFVDPQATSPARVLGVKLVDFGISTILDDPEQSQRTTCKGTPSYWTPEQILHGEVDLTTDLYAFALLVRDVLVGELRLREIAPDRARADIRSSLAGVDRRTVDLITEICRSCLKQDPTDRPSAARVSALLRSSLRPTYTLSTFPRARALARWRSVALPDTGGQPGNAREGLTALVEWTRRFCGAALLAGLPMEERAEAERALVEGCNQGTTVDRFSRGTTESWHVAAREALAVLRLRVTQDMRLLDDRADAPDDSDATVFPRSLLEEAASAAAGGSDERGCWRWSRLLLDAITRSPLLDGFTLTRHDPDHRKSMVVHLGKETRRSWPAMLDKPVSPAEPFLVRVNAVGKADLGIKPLRLSPFAMFGPEDRELLFVADGNPQVFATPFSAEAIQSPPTWPVQAPAIPRGLTGVGAAEDEGAGMVLPARGTPTLLVPGPMACFGLTTENEWFAVDPAFRLLPAIPDVLPCSSATVGPDGELVAGLFEDGVGVFRGGEWIFAPQPAAALSVARTRAGLAVGTVDGGVSRVARGHRSRALFSLSQPVVELVETADCLCALGARGAVAVACETDEEEIEVQFVETEDLGRPVGMFETRRPGRVGVFAASRLGLVDGPSAALVRRSERLEDDIRTVVALGEDPASFAVLGDSGDLWLVGPELDRIRPLRLPGSSYEITGLAAASDGGILCWTRRGELFWSDSHGTSISRLLDHGVVVACGDPWAPALALAATVAADGELSLQRVRCGGAQ